jgi:hypothetical protein
VLNKFGALLLFGMAGLTVSLAVSTFDNEGGPVGGGMILVLALFLAGCGIWLLRQP